MQTVITPEEAFKLAIQKNYLSDDPKKENYAGHYMYMGPSVKVDHIAFKHIDTRQSFSVPTKETD
jgi:hypothetical protein